MNDKEIKKGIEEIKNIKMTAGEKQQIFESILNTPTVEHTKIRSPWFTHFFITSVSKSRLAYYVVVPLIVIITSGGVVFASEKSLPDSALYPIKVGVVEPVREALTFSKTAKASYESNLATKRMIEAETLAIKGKLDTSNEEKINILLEKHSEKFTKTINEIDKKGPSKQVDEIVVNFQTEMNFHAKTLNDVIVAKKEVKKNKEENEDKESKEEIKKALPISGAYLKQENFKPASFSATSEESLESVSEPSIEIEKKLEIEAEVEEVEVVEVEVEEGEEEVEEENEISKSARMSADRIGERFKNNEKYREDYREIRKNEDKKSRFNNKYKEKRED